MLTGGKSKGDDGVGQILSGLGSLISGNREGQGIDLGSVLEAMSSTLGQKQSGNEANHIENGMNFESMLNMASLFLGQNGNAEGLMGFLPMILDSVSNVDNSHDNNKKEHDHTDHSWWVPPILENFHVMWDHFR